LFICKKFSENLTYENDKNKGLIVESIYQKGTTFSFILENKIKLMKVKGVDLYKGVEK
jgi:hypothetical protein